MRGTSAESKLPFPSPGYQSRQFSFKELAWERKIQLRNSGSAKCTVLRFAWPIRFPSQGSGQDISDEISAITAEEARAWKSS